MKRKKNNRILLKWLKFYEGLNWCSLKIELEKNEKVEITLFNLEFRVKEVFLKKYKIPILRVVSLNQKSSSVEYLWRRV